MINIEQTNSQLGYISNDFTLEAAVIECNSALENGQMIFLNGKPFIEDIILDTDLAKISSICITNKLTGG